MRVGSNPQSGHQCRHDGMAAVTAVTTVQTLTRERLGGNIRARYQICPVCLGKAAPCPALGRGPDLSESQFDCTESGRRCFAPWPVSVGVSTLFSFLCDNHSPGISICVLRSLASTICPCFSLLLSISGPFPARTAVLPRSGSDGGRYASDPQGGVTNPAARSKVAGLAPPTRTAPSLLLATGHQVPYYTPTPRHLAHLVGIPHVIVAGTCIRLISAEKPGASSHSLKSSTLKE
ncbi:hypothetical protein QBC47DRAFT_179503 [Echria macrotheca]|uniref:Uncharacterized protein n=1 Tax=Echria macrotheca TaxID=438768 RepID=A0AAJ0BFB9_9PEZI|nr:hypothetical protein QBC47DRAFT_179503 [Echria macrotheca]